MARYKSIHKGLKLLPVDFDRQVIPGSFEHALCHLVDNELDLASFHARYKNDDTGASAFDPAVLIKIALLAYSRGIISSRKMEAACRENILFIAVSGDSQPHFTTLAAFVSQMGDSVAKLFAQVLLICDRQGLIGRDLNRDVLMSRSTRMCESDDVCHRWCEASVQREQSKIRHAQRLPTSTD